MQVVVTGGAGYIGSYVCRELLRAGHEVIVIDDLSTGKEANLPKSVDFFVGDFTDLDVWQQLLVQNQPVVVVHLAAKIDANESVLNSELYIRENAGKTKDLLKIVKNAGISKFILASSAAVYGDAEIVPTPEDTELKPLNPYGQSKKLAEQLLLEFTASGAKGVALRFFNVCGSLPYVKVYPGLDAALISSIKLSVYDPAKIFTIFGDDYPTPDGTCQRDFVHVADIAAAFSAVIDNWDDLENFEVINIGTGQPHSVMQVVKKAEEISGKQLNYQIAPPRGDEIVVSVADNAKMKELLGLQLKYSDLDTIIRSSL